jgi:hypothetical protein
MALSKETVIDKIEIIENGSLQIRQAIRIIEDGNIVSQSFHRYVLHPGQDVAEQPTNVQAIANVVWTQDVIDAYQANIQDI